MSMPDTLAAVVAALQSNAGLVATCTGGIFGTYAEGWENLTPSIVVQKQGGDAPIEGGPFDVASVRLNCYGGEHDDGTNASAVYRAAAAVLNAVDNDTFGEVRIIDCLEQGTESVGVEDGTTFVVSASDWQVQAVGM